MAYIHVYLWLNNYPYFTYNAPFRQILAPQQVLYKAFNAHYTHYVIFKSLCDKGLESLLSLDTVSTKRYNCIYLLFLYSKINTGAAPLVQLVKLKPEN